MANESTAGTPAPKGGKKASAPKKTVTRVKTEEEKARDKATKVAAKKAEKEKER